MHARPAHPASLANCCAAPHRTRGRLAALADGIEPPENMRRCFANNYDIEVGRCCTGMGGASFKLSDTMSRWVPAALPSCTALRRFLTALSRWAAFKLHCCTARCRGAR